MRFMGLFAVALAATGTVAALAASPALSDGAQIFKSRCAVCHSAVAGKNGVGPSLYRIDSRHAAAQPGYAYSPALKASRLVWNENTLDRFLAAPQTVVPGTKMPMAVADPQQRKALIAYLRGL